MDQSFNADVFNLILHPARKAIAQLDTQEADISRLPHSIDSLIEAMRPGGYNALEVKTACLRLYAAGLISDPKTSTRHLPESLKRRLVSVLDEIPAEPLEIDDASPVWKPDVWFYTQGYVVGIHPLHADYDEIDYDGVLDLPEFDVFDEIWSQFRLTLRTRKPELKI